MKKNILVLCLAIFAANAQAQVAGDRVLAYWEPDGLWYPGEIDYVDRQGFHIIFDDDDEAVVSRHELRPLNWRVGSRIECNWQNGGEYYPGRVTSMRGERIDFLYDDGARERLTVSSCRSR